VPEPASTFYTSILLAECYKHIIFLRKILGLSHTDFRQTYQFGVVAFLLFIYFSILNEISMFVVIEMMGKGDHLSLSHKKIVQKYST